MSKLVKLRRRAAQLVFFAAFVVLFATAAYWRGGRAPVEASLRGDPLLALSTMLSLRQLVLPLLWFSLPVVILSLLMGRAYCGWVCPMGTALDLSERVLRIRGRRPAKAPPWRRLKFYVLVALLVTMLLPVGQRQLGSHGLRNSLGLSAVYLVDPISILTRTATFTFFPGVQWAANETSQTALVYSYSDFVSRRPLLERVLQPLPKRDAVARPHGLLPPRAGDVPVLRRIGRLGHGSESVLVPQSLSPRRAVGVAGEVGAGATPRVRRVQSLPAMREYVQDGGFHRGPASVPRSGVHLLL